MHKRCSYPKSTGWKYYGGAGITVCAEWSDFATFRVWADANGYADHLTIDRVDGDLVATRLTTAAGLLMRSRPRTDGHGGQCDDGRSN
jgi:hypothetical protein